MTMLRYRLHLLLTEWHEAYKAFAYARRIDRMLKREGFAHVGKGRMEKEL